MTDLFDSINLPESIKELREFLGDTAVLALIKQYGGTRLFINKNPRHKNNQALIDLIGIQETNALCANYPSDSITIPVCPNAKLALRNRQILLDKRRGLTLAQLARKHGLTEQAICLILRKAEKEELKARRQGLNHEP
jgi:hypothetical protein